MRDDRRVGKPVSPFTGRDAERGVLRSALLDADAGRPAFVLLGGDAGAGKTRLLQEFTAEAGIGGRTVVLGACVPSGDFGLAYLPVIDVLRQVEDDDVGREVLRAEVAHRPALGRLVPHLADGLLPPEPEDVGGTAGSPGSLPLGDGLQQVQLFEAVHRVLLALADRATVVLVVEDVHWADRSTRDLLAVLARTLRTGRVMVVASYRTDDLNRRHPLRPLLAELGRLPGVQRLLLPAFSRAELAVLLDGAAGTPVAADRLEEIFRRSEGNAFFAEELLRATEPDPAGPGDVSMPATRGRSALSSRRAELPDQLADLLLGRVQELPPEGKVVLRLAAVAGRRVTTRVLAAAAQDSDIDTGLRQAMESGLVILNGDSVTFRHALLQEAVYDDLLPGERVRLHARFADVLSASAETDTGGAAEVAVHRMVSLDLAGALRAFVAAAGQAEAVAAPAEALQHLERALQLHERIGDGADRLDLLTRAARAASGVGEYARAVDHARSAVTEADDRPDPEVRARTRERLARFLLQSEDEHDAASAAREAVDLLTDRPPTPLLARTLSTLARTVYWIDAEEGSRLLERAVEVADATGVGYVAADALVTRAGLIRRGLVPGSARSLLASAVRRAQAGPAGGSVMLRALRFQASQLIEDGEQDAALIAADTGIRLATESGMTWSGYGLDLSLMRGWILHARGQWDELLAANEPWINASTAPGRMLATQALAVLIARGSPDADAVLARLRMAGESLLEIQLDLLEIQLRTHQRQLAQIPALAAHARRLTDDPGFGTERLLLAGVTAAVYADQATSARATSKDDAAHIAAANAVIADLAGLDRQPALQGPYGRLLAARAAAERDRATGTDDGHTWQAVADAADRIGRLPERAYARFREAQARLYTGQRDEKTVSAIRSALEDTTAMGATLLHAQITELSRGARLTAATGLTTMAPSSTGGPLTERENEVLCLVAAGRTNRQIGSALFISDKTASVHVSNILRKLDAASRTEATAHARQRGLLE